MLNVKFTVLLATLVTVSGVFPTIAKAQLRTIIELQPNPYQYRVKPDNSQAGREQVLKYRAVAERDKGDYQAAARTYMEIIKINPQSAEAYRNLGLTLKNNLNEPQLAAKYFRRAAVLYEQQGNRSMAQNSIELITSPVVR